MATSTPNSAPEQAPRRAYPIPPVESDPSWNPVRLFLLQFHASIFCFIPDAESVKHLPVTHSDLLDPEMQREGYGVFYSVNGFKNSRRRTKDNLLSLNAVYVDIDWPKDRLGAPSPEDLAAFKRDALESLTALSVDGFLPTFIVETKNGFHALWSFTEPIILDNLPPDRAGRLFALYSTLELALIDRFNGDPAAHDTERVLRMPNTWHLKEPHRPFLTKLIHSDLTQTFTIKHLYDFFVKPGGGKPVSPDPENELPISDSVPGAAWKKATGSANEPLPPEAFDHLNKSYPKCERPSIKALMAKSGVAEGRRNQSLTIAVSAMREDGKTEADCLAYFDHYNGLSAFEIQSVVKSVYRRPKPYSFGWNNPIVAAHVTQEERARVSVIISSFAKNFRQESRTRKMMEEIKDDELPERAQKLEEKKLLAQNKEFRVALNNRFDRVILERHPYIRYLNTTNQFYEYAHGVYSMKPREEMKMLVTSELEKDGLLEFRTDTNVRNRLLGLQSLPETYVEREHEDPNLMNLENGLYDIQTGDFRPHTPDVFLTTQLRVSYRNEPIKELAPRWLKFIHEIMKGDELKIRFLQQMAGYLFTRSTKYQKAFILFGSGANGKSTFIDTISKILGEQNASSLTLDDLHKQFGLWGLYGKTLNVIEEISGHYFESDVIKKVITGSEVMADRKFQERKTFRPFAKFVFAVNQLPKINDVTTGLYRRFYIVDFDASFVDTGETDLPETLWRERDGIFLWCVAGLRDLLSNGGFFVPASIMDATERFKEQNSPLVEFLLREYEIVPPERASMFVIPVANAFEAYQSSVQKLGYQPKNFQNFCREIGGLNHKALAHVFIDTFNGTKVVRGIMLKKSPTTLPPIL